MREGFKDFFRRAVQAVFFYSALSTLSHYFQGTAGSVFFNPATNDLVIGLYVLFFFCWYGGKGLREMPFFAVNSLHSKLAFFGAVALFAARTILFGAVDDLFLKVFSFGAIVLLVFSLLGRERLLFLWQKYWIAAAFGALAFFLIEIYLSWAMFFVPVYMVMYLVFLFLGFDISIAFVEGLPLISLHGAEVVALPSIAGVESIMIFVLFFLGYFSWYFNVIDKKKFYRLFVLGLLGAIAIILLRTALLFYSFTLFPEGLIYLTAQNPLNHVIYIAYSIWFWAKVRPRVLPETHHHSHRQMVSRLARSFRDLAKEHLPGN